MKTFTKYDFYFQLALYFICIFWSLLDGDFKSNFAISLFFIGCSQTISFIIREVILQRKNLIHRIYTVGYYVFLLSCLGIFIVQFDALFVYIAFLINIMAILFLISSFIDYKNFESVNL